ncbi:hypothetical protein AURDEDRAFT_167037 [Auricularia subglabra TFB-10046 SS5]|nr:hypothetical protein AURDEDRAFT_167037 [Auricularia subglabra TFB-10046 SS5]
MFLAGALFVLSLARATMGSPMPAASDSVHIATERGAVEFNERTLAHDNRTHGMFLTRRAGEPAWSATHPGLKATIDAAVAKTAPKPHFFWSGRIAPLGALAARAHADSVMPRAMALAKQRGGTTLELTIDSLPLPDYKGGDPDREEIWQYASDEYANAARGEVFFVKGESLRPGNVWEVYEYPRLKKNPAVKRIMQITVRRSGPEEPKQIYPQTKGCDGVFLIDKSVTCPAGAKLYYGSAQKPVVTAKTTAAKDGVIKIAPGGNAPGITRACAEILSGDFISEVFEKSGVCDLATSKGNNGKAMTAVKKLLDSTRNRKYLQQQRLIKITAKVLDTPIMFNLLSPPVILDALVSIDYFEKTRAEWTGLTQEIDRLVTSATGKSPGLTAAWAKRTAALKPTKAALLVELQKQVAAKAKQAKETAARKDACGQPPSAPGSPASPSRPASPKPPRLVRRHLSSFSPAPLSSLERRVPKTPRSGAKAPAAPSCPLPGAKPKKVVPRDKVKPKPTPAKKPRVARTAPKARPAAHKKTVKRPASRPRRQPGKAAQKKRITPKKQPRKVPRPTKKPKGTARPRRGRR